MTLSAKLTMAVVATDDTLDELSRLTDYLNLARGVTFTQGVLANQVNMAFHDQRTLTDAATETLDFRDSSLTNKVGVALALDILKVLFIKNNSADAGLIIGNAASEQLALFGAAAHTAVIPPGGEYVYIAPDLSGLDVSSAAKLKFLHDGVGSDDLIYDLVIYGVDSP